MKTHERLADLETRAGSSSQERGHNAGPGGRQPREEERKRFRDAMCTPGSLPVRLADNESGRSHVNPADAESDAASSAHSGLRSGSRKELQESVFTPQSTDVCRGAFGLLRTLRVNGGDPAPPEPSPVNLVTLVSQLSEQVSVLADGGRKVRIVMRDDVLPGVDVTISEEQGRWCIDFTASHTGSFIALADSGMQIVNEVSKRVDRDIHMQLRRAPRAMPEYEWLNDSSRHQGNPR